MSIRRPWLFLTASLLAAGAAGAGLHRVGAPPTSVAIVEMTSLINESAEAKFRAEALNKSIEPLRKELKDLQDKAEGKSKEVELLPKNSKDQLAAIVELQKVKATYEAYSKLYNTLADLQIGEMHRDTYLSAIQAVQRVAKKDGFQLVLLDDRKLTFPANSGDREVSSIVQNKRILFAEDAVDITDRVMTDMNNAFNAPAPKSGAGK